MMTTMLVILLLLGGGLPGYVLGRARRSRPVAPAPGCPCCGATIGEHDPETGRCLREFRREHYAKNGTRNGHEWIRCPCRSYRGPELLPSIWAPGTTLPLPPMGSD